MRKAFHLEHEMDETAREVIKWGLILASVLVGTAIALSLLGPGHRLYALYGYFAEVGMYVFAEGVIGGLLLDVAVTRQGG